MKNIIFFCNKSIGLKCLKYTVEKKNLLNLNIKGVLTKKSETKIINFCKKNKIKIYQNIEELLKLKDLDIGISVQYHTLIKKKIISKFKEIIVNLHMAPLPEYRGCNQFSFAIINKEKYFGTTIHKIDKNIDSGPILFEKRFKIFSKIWVKDLYRLTNIHSFELYKNSIKKIIDKNYLLKMQEKSKKRKYYFYFRSDINKLKQINLNWKLEKIQKYIRATSMSGFEPPFFQLNDKKIKLKI